MKSINLIIIFLFLLVSCGGLKDAGKVLRNEKIQTNDEFLVEKRNPLVLPPNFEEVPKPGSMIKKNENTNKIKKILKVPENENLSQGNASTIEESILNKIRK